MITDLIIFIETPDSPAAQLAHTLAARLSTEPVTDPETAARAALTVRAGMDGLSLTGNGLTVRGDFSAMTGRLRPNELNRELLVRAARCRGIAAPAALDATAGMGEDSILLAAAGFQVTMFEQDPVIAALLEDALRRGLEDPAISEIISRMHLVHGDSIAAMRSIGEAISAAPGGAVPAVNFGGAVPAVNSSGMDPAVNSNETREAVPVPDVIYLDPMFPERSKSSLVERAK